MSTTKEDIATDITTNLNEADIAWLAVEIGEHYIDNETEAKQFELHSRLAVDGFGVSGFCRKKKNAPPH